MEEKSAAAYVSALTSLLTGVSAHPDAGKIKGLIKLYTAREAAMNR